MRDQEQGGAALSSRPAGPPDVSGRGRGRTSPATGNRDFRRVWSAHSISVFGDQLTLVALPLAAYAETRSALAVGVVASAEAATALVLGLPAGALADRLPHRRVLVLTDVGRAVLLAALSLALLATDGALAPLVAAALGLGVLRVLHDAAAGAVLPLVVETPELLGANSHLHASEAASTAVGPALAGSLIAVGGAATAFAADAVTFLVSGGLVRRVRRMDRPPPADDPPVPPRVTTSLRADMAEGLRALWQDRPMRIVVGMAAALNLLSVCVEAQFIPYAHEVLGVGAFGIGAYFALGGSAAVLTSLVVAGRTTARGDVVVAGLGVYASGILLAGLAPSLVTAGVAYLAAGVGSALVMTHLTALRHHRFPLHLQGRVAMVTRTLLVALLPVALVGGGRLAMVAGPAALFVVTACIGLLAALGGLASGVGRVREG